MNKYAVVFISFISLTLIATKKENLMIHIGLSVEVRKEMCESLNRLLANEFTLYTKTVKYHWNVVGPHFGPLHELFGKQYEQLQQFSDNVAERIRQLGYMPIGTLKEFMDKATIEQKSGDNPADMVMIKNLLDGHEVIIKQLRQEIELSSKLNDMGTNNFLSDLIEKHEKIAWMLRAHLQK